MSFRIRALAIASATLLAACSQDAHIVAPRAAAPARAFVINPAVACNGATMPIAECEALVALYNSTNGIAWESSDNWGVSPNPCTWYGVSCTGGAVGSVKELNLFGNTLNGTLPAALGNLTALWTLDLHDNQLTGSIPGELGSLPNLRTLALQENQLTGTIPAALGNLTVLQRLLFYDNQLSGLVPLAFAVMGEQIFQDESTGCYVGAVGNEGLYIPDTPAYRAADTYPDGFICHIGFSTAEDVGDDAIDEIDDLVPEALNEGQANALKAKIENAMAKADNGQYGAAINQMQAFLGQLNDMVANGTLTPAQAAPFIDQAQSLIAIWTAAMA